MSESDPHKPESTGGPQARESKVVMDKELEEYRNLLDMPTEFRSGFGWTAIVGMLFCGLLMFPGAIYLGLMAGVGLNSAAQWVTVIIFSEITRRALKSMSRQEMVVLLMVAGAMIGGNALHPGGPFGNMIWRQYLVTSDAVKDAGLYGAFPEWFAPSPDSDAIVQRTFFHQDWIVPMALLVYISFNNFIDKFTLGYAMFRLTSDVEKLPFPMAPIGAQGTMALAEGQAGERTWRWTAFSVGAVLGLGFGAVQVGVPTITGIIWEKPVFPIPIPWIELTPVTGEILPATPTGIVVDLGLILLGFVIPFWAVMGSFFSVLMTFILNPILYHADILTTWQPGMDTVNTKFANQVDFYFAFGLGMAFGVALVSLYSTVMQVRIALREAKAHRLEGERTGHVGEQGDSMWDTPPGRGDWPMWLAVGGYGLNAALLVVVCKILVPQLSTFFMVMFAFVYTPLVTYLNARIAGIAGQNVNIPFVREAFILLSGVRGVDPWLLPLPIENHGNAAQEMRTFELTGTKLTDKVLAFLVKTPLIFILSLLFWSFLWADGPIPSDLYPYAQQWWELQAMQQMILYSSTAGAEGTETLFEQAWNWNYLFAGVGFTVVMFAILSFFGLPTMLIYGLIRGLGQVPHGLVIELVGAFIARLYFHRKVGRKRFLQAAPVIMAGYFTGIGLIGMIAVGIKLISSGISQAPF